MRRKKSQPVRLDTVRSFQEGRLQQQAGLIKELEEVLKRARAGTIEVACVIAGSGASPEGPPTVTTYVFLNAPSPSPGVSTGLLSTLAGWLSLAKQMVVTRMISNQQGRA